MVAHMRHERTDEDRERRRIIDRHKALKKRVAAGKPGALVQLIGLYENRALYWLEQEESAEGLHRQGICNWWRHYWDQLLWDAEYTLSEQTSVTPVEQGEGVQKSSGGFAPSPRK